MNGEKKKEKKFKLGLEVIKGRRRKEYRKGVGVCSCTWEFDYATKWRAAGDMARLYLWLFYFIFLIN